MHFEKQSQLHIQTRYKNAQDWVVIFYQWIYINTLSLIIKHELK